MRLCRKLPQKPTSSEVCPFGLEYTLKREAMLRVTNPQVLHPLADTDLIEVVLEFDEKDGSFTSYVPALNGISTYGKDYEQTLDRTAEMILGWFDSMDDLGLRIPLPKRKVAQLRELLA